MPSELTIRPAEPPDAACIAALGFQVFMTTYATEGVWPSISREALGEFSVAAIEFQLSRPNVLFLIAEIRERVVGFAQLSQPADEMPEGAMVLARLYVQEPFTRKGVGRALLARAEEVARAQRAPLLTLTAWVGNPRALTFYASQGYEDVGPNTFTFEGESYENRKFLKTL